MNTVYTPTSPLQAMSVDVTTCDREPIHIPGCIQPHGMLIAARLTDFTIMQVSANSAAFCGLPPARLLGESLQTLFSATRAQEIHHVVRTQALEANPQQICSAIMGKSAVPLAITAHTYEGMLLLECETATATEAEARDLLSEVQRAIRPLAEAGSLRAYAQMVAQYVQRLTGYEHVMVFQFHPDGNGAVIGEVRPPDVESYLDKHFPGSDVPQQARRLFALNTLRMTPDVRYTPVPLVPELNPDTGRPLDLSYAFLRHASVMCNEYKQNMHKRANFVLALTAGPEQLWGFISCFHRTPKHLSASVRTACKLLSALVSLHLRDREAREDAAYEVQVDELQHRLLTLLTGKSLDVMNVMQQLPQVLDIVEAGGAAVVTQDQCLCFGHTPDEGMIRGLVAWIEATYGEKDVFASDALSTVYAPAAAYTAVASGVLAVCVPAAVGKYVLWFRPELPQTVNWAGNPQKPMEVGPHGERLTPRKSFALWQELVRGRSVAWKRREIDASYKLRVALSSIVLRQAEELLKANVALQRRNTELEAFAYTASHDLKEPLRGLSNLAEFLLEDHAEALGTDGQAQLQRMQHLARRMQDLLDSLLHYARLGYDAFTVVPVSLDQVVERSLELIQRRLAETGAQVHVHGPLGETLCDEERMVEVFTNLLTNAAKYNDKSEKLIEVGRVSPGDTPQSLPTSGDLLDPQLRNSRSPIFYVRDNGIGIAPEQHAAVFEIFRRLHGGEEYGGGTGTGLTIVKRIIERHGGRIWLDSTPGHGTTFFFTLAPEDGQHDEATT